MKEADYIIYTDGGSRGNPGPAALGVVIKSADGSMIKEYGEYIGETTNNDAEYQAVVSALKKLRSLIGKDKAKKAIVEVNVDSELLQKQVTGQYKINDENIGKLFIQIRNLIIDYGQVEFYHVLRQNNKDADRMVNVALDKEINKLL